MGGETRPHSRCWRPPSGFLLCGKPRIVFVLACVLIVAGTEAMYRTQSRAVEAEAEARLARAVRDSEARLKAVVDAAVDGMITIDDKGIIQLVNAAAVSLIGYPPAEVVGHNISRLMPEPDRGQHDRYLREYLSTGKGKIIGFGREVQGRRKDGAVFPMDLAVSETTLDGNRPFIGMVPNIGERKRAEAQGQLTGGVAHDFNNPADSHRRQPGVARNAARGGCATRAIAQSARRGRHGPAAFSWSRMTRGCAR